MVEGFAENQKKILILIKQNSGISKKKLAEKIGISTTAVDKNIASLKKRITLKSKEEKYNMRKCGLPPVINNEVGILILGSFPGEKSLKEQQYYASPNNQFWKIMSEVVEEDLVNVSYEDKKCILLKHHIGLWDVIKSCERTGSSDKNILNPEYNDFSIFFKQLKLRVIGFNGGKAYKLRNWVNIKTPKVLLDSSSGLYPKPIIEKTEQWLNALFNQSLPSNLSEIKCSKNNLSKKKENPMNIREIKTVGIQKSKKSTNTFRKN